MWWGLGLDLNRSLAAWKKLQDEKTEKEVVGSKVDAAELEALNAQINQHRENFRGQRRAGSIHILMGIGSSLLVVLVCSIAVTYFIGTGRWCREVVDAYKLAPEILQENNRLKRRSFPWALCGMLTALGISALGAAADPGTGMAGTERWVTPHLFAALAGICLISYCLYVLWCFIVRNNEIINRVMHEVHTRRAGLDPAVEREGSSGVVSAG
tara:strand:+ start:4069 stop:4704 length:636 start_codon:yes stop_codon:yes gene_type:complete